MNILVCVSKAPDTTSKIAFTNENRSFDENGIQFIVNPYDEWYALVRALELKEQNGGSVTIITVGNADCDPIIRKALAIGADSAVRIDADSDDPMYIAKQIADYAGDKNYDMILCGKETINYNGAVVPGMIAASLNIPFIPLATKLDSSGGVSTIERDVQGGTEILEVQGAFVLSAAKGMAEQRIPNMRGIMAARTKPLNVVPGSQADAKTEVVEFGLPPAKSECTYVDAENPEQLIDLLKNEAKII